MHKIIVYLFLFAPIGLHAQKNPASFRVVPLGVKGGIDESNLSGYLVAPAGTNEYICLDAGTIYAGIQKAVPNKVLELSK